MSYVLLIGFQALLAGDDRICNTVEQYRGFHTLLAGNGHM